jgi:hypothetical protein
MSYSLNSKCAGCNKEPECTDQVILQGAIQTIHGMNQSIVQGYKERGHRGAGTVDLNCQNFEERESLQANQCRS